MKLPPLENVRVFTVVASLRSFTAAADSLALSHSAVSRRVSELEARLGVQLLQRTSRQVSLTSAGKIFYEVAQEALTRLHDVTLEIQRPASPRPLLISCERSLAMLWLIPRLSGFQDTHPDIPIYLSTGGGAIDLTRENIDLAIRRADFSPDHRFISIPLFDEYIGPVISTSHQSSVGKRKLKRLHTTGRPTAWNFWRQQSNRHGKNRGVDALLANMHAQSEDQYFDHFFLSLQAAEAGLGVAIAPLFLVADNLAANKLEAPYGFIADQSRYIALMRNPLIPGSHEAQFMQWLRETIADTLEKTASFLCKHSDC